MASSHWPAFGSTCKTRLVVVGLLRWSFWNTLYSLLCARSFLAMDLDSEGDQSLSTFVRFDNADLGLPPGESDSEASPAQASCFRRSRRLAGEEPALPDRPTGDLSLSEILEALFRRDVPAPVNAFATSYWGFWPGVMNLSPQLPRERSH